MYTVHGDISTVQHLCSVGYVISENSCNYLETSMCVHAFYIYICIHMHTYIYTYIHMSIYIYTYIHWAWIIYIHMIYIYIMIYIYTHDMHIIYFETSSFYRKTDRRQALAHDFARTRHGQRLLIEIGLLQEWSLDRSRPCWTLGWT
jgi:hypothetical protein